MIGIKHLTKVQSARGREVTAPTGDRTVLPDTTVLDVTFHGEATAQPLISQLSRTYSIDVTILGTAIETANEQIVSRMRIGLPGRFEDNVVQIGFLRERGLSVEAVTVSSSVLSSARQEAAS